MYYKTNENGEIITVSIYQPQTEEWQETDKELVWSIAQNAFVDVNEIDEQAEKEAFKAFNTPPPPTVEEIKQGLINLVQQHLDAKCQSMGYDNGFACASYATSSVPKFKAEAEAFVLWRDRVWSYCYEQLDLFEAGQREIPTDIIAELPDWSEPND